MLAALGKGKVVLKGPLKRTLKGSLLKGTRIDPLKEPLNKGSLKGTLKGTLGA